VDRSVEASLEASRDPRDVTTAGEGIRTLRREMPNPNERFADRHIGPGPDDIEKMLATIGAASLDDLVAETIPASIIDTDLDLPPALSEGEIIARLRDLASKNVVMTSLIGLGYHDTITPPVIQRNVLENPSSTSRRWSRT
jgi:glycine cleavage system pyridoxal-binding protein P